MFGGFRHRRERYVALMWLLVSVWGREGGGAESKQTLATAAIVATIVWIK